MNRAALRYLFERLHRASRPIFVASLPPGVPAPARDDLAGIILALGASRTSCVLPMGSIIEIVKPRNAVRVVAGKGGKRRGLRRAALPRITYQAL